MNQTSSKIHRLMQLKVEARTGHTKTGKRKYPLPSATETEHPLPVKKPKRRKNGGHGGGEESDAMPSGQLIHGETAAPKAGQSATEGNGHIAAMTLMPKESLRNFNRRVDNAARQKLHQDANRNTNTAAKKKDWNKSKKDRKKDKRGRKQEELEERQDDPFNRTDVVEFGEVAMEPPSLKSRPKVKQTLTRAPLLLASKLKPTGVAPIRKAMLLDERERVIQAYRDHQRSKRDAK